MDKMRLDVWLVQNGHASGRAAACRRIAAGEVQVNGRTAEKPSLGVTDRDVIVCADPGVVYVGRGGYKLEKALETSGLSVQGAVALDIGASTGGFTDCLLRNGAARVYAVDVGHGQLHPSLCADERVVNLEGTDVRSEALRAAVEQGSVDFCCIDVSFVSLTVVFSSLLVYMRPQADIVCLIKPQFEAGRQGVGKGGIVRDRKVHMRVLREVCAQLTRRCELRCLTWSPITGGDGNIEYLAVLRYTGQAGAVPPVDDVVCGAFEALK